MIFFTVISSKMIISKNCLALLELQVYDVIIDFSEIITGQKLENSATLFSFFVVYFSFIPHKTIVMLRIYYTKCK